MRFLLLSDIPPCKAYTGGLVLDQLCRLLPEGSLACYSVVYPGAPGAELSPDLSDIPIRYRDKPREYWKIWPGRDRLNKAASLAGETYNRHITSKAIKADIVQFAREQGVDAVWAVLEGQTVIQLAAPVAKALGAPLYTEVWDPPTWWMKEHGVDPYSQSRVLGSFEEALRTSECCYAASPSMAEEYSRLYGTKTATFMPSLDAALAHAPAETIHDGQAFTIAIAGQNYLSAEWNSLFTALDSVDWVIEGRAIKMRIMSREINLSAVGKRRDVEYLGWRPQDEVVRLIAESDAAYCPYWFSPEFETEARLCFPSKLTSYLAAGRPVLLHGPEYASPARFLNENDAAVMCHSMDPADIVDSIARLITQPELYSRLAKNARSAFDRHLTEESLRSSFAEFLGLDESSLVSPDGHRTER